MNNQVFTQLLYIVKTMPTFQPTILSTLLNVKVRYIVYRVVIATKSSLEKQNCHSTHANKNKLTPWRLLGFGDFLKKNNNA